MMPEEEIDTEMVSRATLSLLETRLRRLEFLLAARSTPDTTRYSSDKAELTPSRGDESVSSKLQNLETNLHNLRKVTGAGGELISHLEALHSKVPEIFGTSSVPLSLVPPQDLSTLSAVVLSHATLFPEAASRLSSLQSLQVPLADQSSKLIEINPKIEAALQKQGQLQNDIDDLRDRSAKCLEWWIKVGVIGMGELFEDWQSRVEDVGRGLRRIERTRDGREGYL